MSATPAQSAPTKAPPTPGVKGGQKTNGDKKVRRKVPIPGTPKHEGIKRVAVARAQVYMGTMPLAEGQPAKLVGIVHFYRRAKVDNKRRKLDFGALTFELDPATGRPSGKMHQRALFDFFAQTFADAQAAAKEQDAEPESEDAG